nr:NADH dehydrogenase subunit 6 [Pseudocaranx dentex]
MTIIMCFVLFMLIFGLIVVASNPSPYFAAFGLVVVAGMGCVVVAWHGGAFLGLLLFLIYLGGMLVVFAYTAALAAEPYPETLGSPRVAVYVMAALVVVITAGGVLWQDWHESSWRSSEECGELSMSRQDMMGVAALYSSGGLVLVLTALGLLLALFVALELARGMSRGAMRAV